MHPQSKPALFTDQHLRVLIGMLHCRAPDDPLATHLPLALSSRVVRGRSAADRKIRTFEFRRRAPEKKKEKK